MKTNSSILSRLILSAALVITAQTSSAGVLYYSSTGSEDTDFGTSLTLYQGTLYVGTSGGGINGSGSVESYGWMIDPSYSASLEISPGSHLSCISHNRDFSAPFLITGNPGSLPSDFGVAYAFSNGVGVELRSGESAAQDRFGYAVAADRTFVLVGSPVEGAAGSVYYFSDATASGGDGSITANGKLNYSGSSMNDWFGCSISMSNNNALVGALNANNIGAVAFYRDVSALAQSNGTETALLTGSNSDMGDGFGAAIAISSDGNSAVVGASMADSATFSSTGVVYYYGNLSFASGTITETTQLYSSSASSNARFGEAVSLDNGNVLIGAPGDTGPAYSTSGAVYYFKDVASNPITSLTETLKITPNTATSQNDSFGCSVALDGDQFAIGAKNGNTDGSGAVYYGTISSMTTLDENGGATRTISDISFDSKIDWLIGSSYSGNHVTLETNSTARLATIHRLFIGENVGSNNNSLIVKGRLEITNICIGVVGNSGNNLTFTSGATHAMGTSFILAADNSLSFEGEYSDGASFMSLFSANGDTLSVLLDSGVYTITTDNFDTYLSLHYENNFTTVTNAVPEPALFAFLGGLGALTFAGMRRRRTAKSFRE